MSRQGLVFDEYAVSFVGEGTDLGRRAIAKGRSALILGDPSARGFVLEGTRRQLRALVRRLQERLEEAWGYQHPLMSAAIDALAAIGVNAEVDSGPSPGMIILEAALSDGTILAIWPGDDNWWPSREDHTWRFTGW